MPEEEEVALTQEERLKGLLYQYISLYERWSEDRQVAAKRGADHAELLKQFSAQVQGFKTLVSQIQKEIPESVRIGLAQALGEFSEPLQTKAKDNLDRLVMELDRVVYQAQSALSAYQASHAQEVKRSQWKVIGMVVIVCVLLSSLAIYLNKPPALDGKELEWMYSGHLMNQIYPRLSSDEQAHWQKIADQVMAEERVKF